MPQTLASTLPQPVENDDFHGFPLYRFRLSGRAALLAVPAETAPSRPWIWRARFFGHEPQTDIALLKAGWHLAYIDVADLFGSPEAVGYWNDYYRFLTEKLDLGRKPVLEGMSRGGLIVYNWAKQNPDKVAAVYADAPVCNLASWPGGLGEGEGSPADLANALKQYNLTAEELPHFDNNPIDGLEGLAAADVPLLHVCGTADTVVPMTENSDLLERRYRELGGRIRVIRKPGVGHHPHSLPNPSVIVNFLKGRALGENDFLKPRRGLRNSGLQFLRNPTGRVAFLGGSITEMNGYSAGIEASLQKLFPDCRFDFINAGIGSTCSDTGAYRLDSDILQNGKVDLLFVEFAVNDNQDGHFPPEKTRRAVEGIIRRARRHNPLIDIVLLYCANESHLAGYRQGKTPQEISANEAIADAYGLPSVNFAADVAERIAFGEFDWETFGGVHPAPFGAALYADDVTELLRAQYAGLDAGEQPAAAPMPERLDPFALDNGRLLPATLAETDGNWQLAIPDWAALPGSCRDRFRQLRLLAADVPGAELALDFTGRAIGLYLLAGPDAGMVEYRIDNGHWQRLELRHPFSESLHYPYTATLADQLLDGDHRLIMRIAGNAGCRGNAVRIIAFTAN
ncbi:GDSL-type esterase/lipase family protein [Victivallis sp. Marseille-Q1083]|uniref:SGNH/GDSL hydrolase family protein n=1 Tax=Victivallis sp. Marseille-Q1083 TaxID=2717288 RepID=UPI001588C668|nr:GDSL-type esterase/lipase family protein [Victivallis sp. Marseille-Q1083]